MNRREFIASAGAALVAGPLGPATPHWQATHVRAVWDIPWGPLTARMFLHAMAGQQLGIPAETILRAECIVPHMAGFLLDGNPRIEHYGYYGEGGEFVLVDGWDRLLECCLEGRDMHTRTYALSNLLGTPPEPTPRNLRQERGFVAQLMRGARQS